MLNAKTHQVKLFQIMHFYIQNAVFVLNFTQPTVGCLELPGTWIIWSWHCAFGCFVFSPFLIFKMLGVLYARVLDTSNEFNFFRLWRHFEVASCVWRLWRHFLRKIAVSRQRLVIESKGRLPIYFVYIICVHLLPKTNYWRKTEF